MESIIQQAIEKLTNEKNKSKYKAFANPITESLIRRVAESESLAQDIMQKSKGLEKCLDYITDKAKNAAKGQKMIAVKDETVYEWAEDYYRKAEDKVEVKADKKADIKELEAKENKKNDDNNKSGTDESKDDKVTENKTQAMRNIVTTYSDSLDNNGDISKLNHTKQDKHIKEDKQLEGQMDIFSFLSV